MSSAQSYTLLENERKLDLIFLLTRLSSSPNYSDARPLLVIFHDPPEVKGVPDPHTNRLELHNTWLVR